MCLSVYLEAGIKCKIFSYENRNLSYNIFYLVINHLDTKSCLNKTRAAVQYKKYDNTLFMSEVQQRFLTNSTDMKCYASQL